MSARPAPHTPLGHRKPSIPKPLQLSHGTSLKMKTCGPSGMGLRGAQTGSKGPSAHGQQREKGGIKPPHSFSEESELGPPLYSQLHPTLSPLFLSHKHISKYSLWRN